MRKSKLLLFFLPFFLFSCGGLDNPSESENTSSPTEIEIEKGELFDGLSTELVFNDVFEYSFSTKYSGQREFVAQGCNIELYQINENERLLLLEVSNKLAYSFVKETNYVIKIAKDSIHNVVISFNVLDKLVLGNNELSFMPYDTKVVSVETLKKGFYKYKISNENISIDNVEGEFLNICNGKLDYLYLTNNSNDTITTNLNVFEPESVNFGDSFVVDSSNRVVKIENNEENRQDVKIIIQSNESGRCAYFYDEIGNIRIIEAIFRDGKIEYIFSLLSEEFAYIDFSHDDSSISVNVYEG